jgi:hypothetical protein
MAADAGASADGPAALLRRVAGIRRTLPELQDGLFLNLGDVSRKLSRFWILFTLCGYRREERATRGFRRRPAYAVITASLVLIVVPLGLTTMQTAREQVWLDRASTAASSWAAQGGYALMDVSFDGPELDVVIEGTGPSPPGSQLLARLRDQVPADTPVVVSTINGGMVAIGRVPA